MRGISAIHILALLVAHAFAIETVYDAAVIARKLVDLSVNSIATMGTVFPSDHPTLGGRPFALQEYYASCLRNGSLTLLILPISTHGKNVQHSSTHSASLTITSQNPAASNARVSLIGNITVYENAQNMSDLLFIRHCYLGKHPDAKSWLPGDDNAAHISYWARFDPQSIYFVGGFGDEHYIGFIPLHLYQNAVLQKDEAVPRPLGLAGRIMIEQYK